MLPEDVLVMGSDGLFDNVAEDEILDIVVKVRYCHLRRPPWGFLRFLLCLLWRFVLFFACAREVWGGEGGGQCVDASPGLSPYPMRHAHALHTVRRAWSLARSVAWGSEKQQSSRRPDLRGLVRLAAAMPICNCKK